MLGKIVQPRWPYVDSLSSKLNNMFWHQGQEGKYVQALLMSRSSESRNGST